MVSLRSKGLDRNAERSKAIVPKGFYRDVQAEYHITNTYGVYRVFVILIIIISHVGFEGWIRVLIALVPDLCMLFTFVIVLVIVLLTGSKQDENCNYL